MHFHSSNQFLVEHCGKLEFQILLLLLHPRHRDHRPNPPTSLLLPCGLLQGRVASPRWVTWIWEGLASITKFDVVSASLGGVDMVVWKNN